MAADLILDDADLVAPDKAFPPPLGPMPLATLYWLHVPRSVPFGANSDSPSIARRLSHGEGR